MKITPLIPPGLPGRPCWCGRSRLPAAEPFTYEPCTHGLEANDR